MTTEQRPAQRFIERAEKARNLKDQMRDALGPDEEQEFQFYEWSPGRTQCDIWSMETGEKITLPRYMAEGAINLRTPDGRYRFTATEEQAPAVRENTVKCFLHRTSPERPFLEELGIVAAGETGCIAEHLANEASKWTHARNRHGPRYQQYQDAISRQEMREMHDLQRKQAEAMMSLAQRSTEEPAKTKPKGGE